MSLHIDLDDEETEMERVEVQEQILRNVLAFNGCRTSQNQDVRLFYVERLRLGKIFIAALYEGRTLFCPSRFAGYKDNTMARHLAFEDKSGSITTPCITSLLGQPHTANVELEKQYLALCTDLEIKASGKNRTYWFVTHKGPPIVEPPPTSGQEPEFPDEVAASGRYSEGAVKQVLVNAYERSPEARQACIVEYGAICAVCSLNFESRYGAIGLGFIHVHHLIPLALRSAEYIVDPIKDLRPVCPNCHSMLHKSDPPFSIEELREVMASC